MKSFVMGHPQQALIKLNISLKEALFLEYLTDFISSGTMKSIQQNGEHFFWLSGTKVLQDLPILGKTRRTISNIILSLEQKNVISRLKAKTNKMFLNINPFAFQNLQEPSTQNLTFVDSPKQKNPATKTQPANTKSKNLSLKQPNTNNQKQQENPTAKPAQISNSKTSISSTRTQKQQPKNTQSFPTLSHSITNFCNANLSIYNANLKSLNCPFKLQKSHIAIPRATSKPLNTEAFKKHLQNSLEQYFDSTTFNIILKNQTHIFALTKTHIILKNQKAEFLKKWKLQALILATQQAEKQSINRKKE